MTGAKSNQPAPYWIIRARISKLYLHGEWVSNTVTNTKWLPARKGAVRFASKESAFAYLSSDKLFFEVSRKPRVLRISKADKDKPTTFAERKRARERARYKKRKLAGACASNGCPNPRTTGRHRCEECLAKARAAQLRYREEHPTSRHLVRNAQGLCADYGCPNAPREGRKRCEQCLARDKENSAKRRREQAHGKA